MRRPLSLRHSVGALAAEMDEYDVGGLVDGEEYDVDDDDIVPDLDGLTQVDDDDDDDDDDEGDDDCA